MASTFITSNISKTVDASKIILSRDLKTNIVHQRKKMKRMKDKSEEK